MVKIEYIETPNSMEALLKVTNPDNPNEASEFRLPKFIADLVKDGINNGTINLSNLWTRSLSVTKEL